MALPTGPSIAGDAGRRVARSAVRVRSRRRGLLASRERGSAAAPTWAPKTPTVNVFGAQGRDRYGDWPPAIAMVAAGGGPGRIRPRPPAFFAYIANWAAQVALGCARATAADPLSLDARTTQSAPPT